MTELDTFSNSKNLPKEYLLLELRIIFNKDLYEQKIISFELFDRMQKTIINKMNKIMLENN